MPMMSRALLRHAPEHRLVCGARAALRSAVIGRTTAAPAGCWRHQALTLLVALATLALTVVLYIAVPKGFFPVQDTGAIQAITEAPQSVSFAAMAERQQAAAQVILQDPRSPSLSSFIGVDGNNATLNTGRMLVTLAPRRSDAPRA